MKRRTVLGGLSVAGIASLAGCLGLVGMDEHESSPGGVDASVRAETGYERTTVDEITVEEDVGVSVASETVSVTNYMTQHEKAVDMGPLGSQRGAVFIVLSTPQVGVAGRNFNPVEEMSAAELVELIEENYDDIGDVTPEEDDEITILESETTRTRFDADATFDGHDLAVDLHVSEAVETPDDDLLVTVGVYPQELRSREAENVVALMEGVAADLETDSGGDGGDGAGAGDGDEEEADDGSDDTGESDGGETDDDGESDDGIL